MTVSGIGLASIVMCGLASARAQSSTGVRRLITVADVIGLASFGSRPPGYGTDIDVPSPDGRLHAVVIKRGDVARNVNLFSLLLFRTDSLFNHPTPDTLLSLASSSNRPAIGSVHWLADNRTVVFLGERPSELPQVYALDIRTRQLTAQTHQTTEITHFDVAPTGNAIVYTARAAVDTSAYLMMRARGFVLKPGRFVGDVLTGVSEATSEWSASRLGQTFIWHGGQAVPMAAQVPGPHYRECESDWLSIAPSGRAALLQCTRDHLPERWHHYRADDNLAKLIADGYVPPEFAVLDLDRGTVTPLVDAPARGTSVRWSPDGTSLVLGNAFLPLTGVDSAEWQTRAAHTAVAEVGLRTGQVTAIAYRDSVDVVAWDSTSNTVECVPGRYGMGPLDGPRVHYQKTSRGWREVKSQRGKSAPVLVVEQGLNQPPRLVAVEPRTGRRAVLFDPNPGLARFRLAREEIIRWRTRSGGMRLGGLYYPPDFVKGRRYPLVIQTHGFDSTAFEPDGVYPTANAAQPMAAQGMLVLQSGAWDDGTWIHSRDFSTPQEAPRAMEEIEGAIDHLDSLGLIDRHRVGVIGFSRTCYHTLYTLTHSAYPIAAAAVTDGVDFSYLQYLMYLNAQLGAFGAFDENPGINGGPPWGQYFETWRERAPGFNLDHVTAPLRLEAIGLTSVLQEWEPYAGLLLQHKPVELFVIPDGVHVLIKPWDRLASSGGNTDWFRFWLKGEEDPDTAKVEQYARWRQLRSMQDSRAAKAIGVSH